MLQTSKIRELSFLVYGLGITGLSVIKFLKEIILKTFKYGMIIKKICSNIISRKI